MKQPVTNTALTAHFFNTVNPEKYERALKRQRRLEDHTRDRTKTLHSRAKSKARKAQRYGMTALILSEA